MYLFNLVYWLHLFQAELPELNVAMVTGFFGLLLTVVFSYFPGLNTKFAGLTEDAKKLWMIGLLALITATGFALGCYGILQELFNVTVVCTRASGITLAQSFFVSVIVNQSFYLILPQTQKVKAVKASVKKDGFPSGD